MTASCAKIRALYPTNEPVHVKDDAAPRNFKVKEEKKVLGNATKETDDEKKRSVSVKKVEKVKMSKPYTEETADMFEKRKISEVGKIVSVNIKKMKEEMKNEEIEYLEFDDIRKPTETCSDTKKISLNKKEAHKVKMKKVIKSGKKRVVGKGEE